MRMVPVLGAALVLGVIAACAGPLYYCKRTAEGRESSYQSQEEEEPVIRIRISHLNRDKIVNDASSDENSEASNDKKETKEVARDFAPFADERSQIAPVRPPRKRRRTSTSIWSYALRNQLENISNSSSEAGGVKLVKTRVEVHPNPSTSRSNLAQNSLHVDSIKSTDESCQRVRKARKLSSIIEQRWKSLKKTFVSSTSEKTAVYEEAYDETQRLQLPVLVAQRSPMGHSTMLHRNRLGNASTSTKVSSKALQWHRRGDVDESFKRNEVLRVDSARHDTDVLENAVSLVQRRSVNGKSVCDVKITGLTMDHAELMDLFEATSGKSKSASIVSTEEASIISIKFHKDRPRESASVDSSQTFDCPLRKFYKSLPERFEEMSISKFFRLNAEQPGKIVDRESFVSSRISNRTKGFASAINDTSYVGLPATSGEKCGRYLTTAK